MSDAFDFSYLEPRETTRYKLHGVHVHCDKPLELILGYGGPGSALRAAYDSGKIKGKTGDDFLVDLMLVAVKGWENAYENGAPVPCVAAEIRDLTEKLIKAKCHDLLWGALNLALDPASFRDAPSAEQLGKA